MNRFDRLEFLPLRVRVRVRVKVRPLEVLW